MLKTNEDRLAKFRLQGNIMHPGHRGMWTTGHDGKARVVPGVAGITLNFKVGDLANKYISDHLEPGVSTTFDGNAKERQSPSNGGYNIFSCIGNEVEVISGKAKGKKGRVTGHHGGCEHVMIDFDQKTLETLTYDDKFMVTAFGVGLQITGFEEISIFSLAPELLKKMKITEKRTGKSGTLEIGVSAIVPAVAMGSGLGSGQSFSGDYDIQTSDPETVEKHALDQLKLGDIVAVMDHDSNFGWSYKQGAVSIGVIIHGDSMIAGHGPGCQTIMTTLSGKIKPVLDKNANIGNYLKIGRYRGK